MLYHERYAKKKGYSIVIGVDEAGRGPLAGPAVVAAVYLKSYKFKAYVNDSKKLSPKQRAEAFDEIAEKSVFGVGFISGYAIDTLNIVESLRLATDMAIEKLFICLKGKRPKPTFKNTIFFLDGRLSSSFPHDSKEIIKGDSLSLSIAAASIVAKVTRDRVMGLYDRVYPQYGFSRHKGYGTKRHLEEIARFGLSPIHRKTFCRGLV